MTGTPDAEDRHLRPAETAPLLGLKPADLSKVRGLTPVRTSGGHRRYLRSDVIALLEQRRAEAVVRLANAEIELERAVSALTP